MLEDELVDRFLQSAPPPPKDNLTWTRAPKWLAIKGITTHELRTFSGQIERGTPLRGPSIPVAAPPKSKVLTFGKYKTKEVDWVKEHDPSYYSWAVSNIPNFLK